MIRNLFRAARGALPAAVLLFTFSPAMGQGEPEVIARIVDEGKNNSKVWLYLNFISQEIGPRLTGSTRLERANNWTRDMFESFGCTNAHLQKWGEIPVRFDREASYFRIVGPVERDLEFTTLSWTAGTDGPVRGRVVKQPANMEELEKMKDQLKGAWVLSTPPQPRGRGQGGPGGNRPATQPSGPGGDRPGAAANRGGQTPPATQPSGPGGRRGGGGGGGQELMQADQLVPALYAAGIAGRITPSGNELVRTGGARGWRELDYDNLSKEVTVTITRADYDVINSRLADGEQVEIEGNLDHRFEKGPIPLYNTVAEIRGTEFPDQVVIVSAHLDSWDGPGSMGTQDNGTGSSVTLEAARILMAAGVQPRRTIRFCLWTGEEQGLLGSREYVNMLSDEEKANISAAFVDDGGTNYQGALTCVADMEEMLRQATAPVNAAFPAMPVEILVAESMPRGGASDHASFNRAGIPGFYWREDGSGGREGKNYPFIHHTQNDTPRYAVEEYLIQSATCSAITAYNLAMADEMLPRAPAPTTQPAEQEGPGGPFTAAPGPLTGTWVADMVREGEVMEGIFTFTLEHAAQGERMRGQMFSRFGEGRLRRVQFNPQTGELTFGFSREGGGMTTYKTVVKGEEMIGSLTSEEGGFTMDFKARRTSKEIQQPAPPEGAGNAPAGERRPAGAGGGAGNRPGD